MRREPCREPSSKLLTAHADSTGTGPSPSRLAIGRLYLQFFSFFGLPASTWYAKGEPRATSTWHRHSKIRK
jgi:hypothetical protein